MLEEILKAHPEMEFVQLQINYADWESSAIESRKCYEVVRKYGKPVVIMEPVKGGILANPPAEAQEVSKYLKPRSRNRSVIAQHCSMSISPSFIGRRM